MMSRAVNSARRSLGVVGGCAPLAGADVFFKLTKAVSAHHAGEGVEVVYEPRPLLSPFDRREVSGSASKLQLYDAMRGLEQRGVGGIVLPSFACHAILGELRQNIDVTIVDLLEALRAHVRAAFPGARRIGVLCAPFVRKERLFERYFQQPEFALLYADAGAAGVVLHDDEHIENVTHDCTMAVCVRAACEALAAQGADVIVPGHAGAALVAAMLGDVSDETGSRADVPVVDVNEVYARYAADGAYVVRTRAFKVGVVGGVGPAATVDFMQKLVQSTPAQRDQDHLKVLVEQNPQIPDRTENLLHNGPDPTVALYATCRRLEEGAADIIAIPCNTAHAFVERIQPWLSVPIVNMLSVTVDWLRTHFPALREVGLLATSGTIASGVYERALAARGLRQVVPDAADQARLMNAIYGPHGVKAGYTAGECVADVHAALDGLVRAGAQLVVLGCTELPLLLREGACDVAGREVWLADPTAILARRCVEYARGAAFAMPEAHADVDTGAAFPADWVAGVPSPLPR
jgi:aspartate racemase